MSFYCVKALFADYMFDFTGILSGDVRGYA